MLDVDLSERSPAEYDISYDLSRCRTLKNLSIKSEVTQDTLILRIPSSIKLLALSGFSQVLLVDISNLGSLSDLSELRLTKIGMMPQLTTLLHSPKLERIFMDSHSVLSLDWEHHKKTIADHVKVSMVTS